MPLNLRVRIDYYKISSTYCATIESIKGILECSDTPEKALYEIMVSLIIKIAYDLGIEINILEDIKSQSIENYIINKEDFIEKGYTEIKINLNLTFN